MYTVSSFPCLFIKAILTLGAQALVHGHRHRHRHRHRHPKYFVVTAWLGIRYVTVCTFALFCLFWRYGSRKQCRIHNPDLEIRGRRGGGGGSPKGPGPQFSFKNKGGGPSAPLPWIRHWETGYAKHWISPELMHTRDNCHTRTGPCSQPLEPCSFARIIYDVNTWKNVSCHISDFVRSGAVHCFVLLLSWLFKMASGRAEWSNYLRSYISDIQGVNTKHCFLETKCG